MSLPIEKKTNDIIRIVCIELWLMFSKYDIYLSGVDIKKDLPLAKQNKKIKTLYYKYFIDVFKLIQKKTTLLYVYPKFSFLPLRCADVIAMHSSIVYIFYI